MEPLPPGANFKRSLELLARSKDAGLLTKSGIMLGLGETRDEVLDVMRDLRGIDVDILTLGQYLQPSKKHLPIERYWEPEAFAEVQEDFRIVASVIMAAEVRKDGSQVRIEGRLATTLECACSRCLEPIPIPVDAGFDLLFVPETVDAGAVRHRNGLISVTHTLLLVSPVAVDDA